MSYTNIEFCKNYLDINEGLNTAATILLTNLISSADVIIDKYCQQSLVSSTTIREFTGNNTNYYQFKEYPVNEIIKIEERQSVKGSYTEIDEDEYALIEESNNNYVFKESRFFNVGFPSYKIEYQHGFASVPESVKLAATMLVAEKYKQADISEKRLGLAGKTENNQFGGSINIGFKEILPEVKELLKPFRVLY